MEPKTRVSARRCRRSRGDCSPSSPTRSATTRASRPSSAWRPSTTASSSLCCLLLSVSISLVLVALCGAAVRARSATDPGRESPPTPVVHRRAAFAQPRGRRASVDTIDGAVQHRERLIAAARAELAGDGGDAPGFARGTSAFAGGDTDELDDAEVPIGAVARTLEPAPWQEGAERRSSAKKAAIPDSRSMPALPRLGRPGSVPPGAEPRRDPGRGRQPRQLASLSTPLYP